MRELIDRQTAIEALKRAEALTRAFGYHNVIYAIREVPTVTRMQEESYQRLIGKKVSR